MQQQQKQAQQTPTLWEIFDPETGEPYGLAWSLDTVKHSFREWLQFGVQLDARRLLILRR